LFNNGYDGVGCLLGGNLALQDVLNGSLQSPAYLIVGKSTFGFVHGGTGAIQIPWNGEIDQGILKSI